MRTPTTAARLSVRTAIVKPARAGRREGPNRAVKADRMAVAVHMLSLVGAIAFWAWEDRKLWFFGDDWAFLLQRSVFAPAGSPQGIWYPHNEHWSTLPVLLWRGLFNAFHLSSYFPYLVPLFLLVAGVMHLLWRLCLRNGAGPWPATVAVALLGFLGAGAEDLGWAFQVGFVGSLFFGLLAWDLMDDGGPARPALARYPLASLALLASLMCSTIGDAMVVGAAVLALAGKPRRRAVTVLALPVVSYATWFALIGHKGLSASADRTTWHTLRSLPGYIWAGFTTSLGHGFDFQPAGAILTVALLAWLAWSARALWHRRPSVLACSTASIVFFGLAATGRDALGDHIPSRYVYICVALVLPVLLVALTPVSRYRPGTLVLVALLLASLAGNVGLGRTWVTQREQLVTSLKLQALATVELLAHGAQPVAGPYAQPVPYEPNLDVADMVQAERAHLFPTVPVPAVDLVNARARLATALGPVPLAHGRFRLASVVAGRASTGPAGCTVFSPSATTHHQAGVLQVRLDITGNSPAASAQVKTAAPPAGAAEYLGVVLSPPRGPASSVVDELPLPPSGAADLSYNDPGTELVLFWTGPAPLVLCGISRPR